MFKNDNYYYRLENSEQKIQRKRLHSSKKFDIMNTINKFLEELVDYLSHLPPVGISYLTLNEYRNRQALFETKINKIGGDTPISL
ncbi:TPA: hypothetical protein U2D46_001281 [Streptococcus suis]|uniref:Uncharacterized protein n=1 Tax=Streptococcus suis TaxID=1307 RepID=A0A116QXS3_STRSU|nr:hypothetical protein [Streptococcus suis]MCK3891285.1 hypothetical protein [Streptococcus suis]MCK3894671.1 hypothetical protein [Streptococcus suis]MDN2948918.1 hypothetical protein [Streptococcus suis]NQM01267.1 hypothetical protein [Streptococcus suis]NQR96510.1 hypothetical protein [Streptococcus suis]